MTREQRGSGAAISGVLDLLGHPVEGPWGSGPADFLLSAALGTEYATGFGEANAAYSTITYGLSFAGCLIGVIH